MTLQAKVNSWAYCSRIGHSKHGPTALSCTSASLTANQHRGYRRAAATLSSAQPTAHTEGTQCWNCTSPVTTHFVENEMRRMSGLRATPTCFDPNRISPDEQPIFDAHVICSVPVARCSELPAAQNIVAFTKDYPFIMCDTKVYACLLRWQRIWPVCAGRRNTTHDKLARPGSTPLVLRGEA